MGIAVSKPRPLNQTHLAYKVLGLQLAFAGVLSLIIFTQFDGNAAILTLWGAGIATIAQGYFTLQAFRYSGARAGPKMVRAFYRGEAGKFVIVIVLMLITFTVVQEARDNAKFLFIGFFGAQSANWLAPWLLTESSK